MPTCEPGNTIITDTIKKELKNLEWQSSGSGWKKTGVVVEFSDLAFHFFSALELGEQEQEKKQEQGDK